MLKLSDQKADVQHLRAVAHTAGFSFPFRSWKAKVDRQCMTESSGAQRIL